MHAPAPAKPRSVQVRAASRAYEVLIGPSLLERAGEHLAAALGGAPRHALVVVDAGLPPPWLAKVKSALAAAGVACCESPQPPQESRKTIASWEQHVALMARQRLDRTDAVLALGGGITGDVAGFAASTYRRGVPWINCPTTLLAMVDASVGGKTGVNLGLPDGLKKNMIGAFHQPARVLADVEALSTLPDRELRCGLSECIKHGMIAAEFGDAGLLEWTERSLGALLARDGPLLTELIARNVAVKAAVVAGDEREEAAEGGRALLNLGHTFAHVLETLPGVALPDASADGLKHGEAVALGLIAATAASAALGLMDRAAAVRIQDVVQRAGLPTAVKGLPPVAELAKVMGHDKKVRAGRVRLVLPTSGNRARVVADPPAHAVETAWNAIRDGSSAGTRPPRT